MIKGLEELDSFRSLIFVVHNMSVNLVQALFPCYEKRYRLCQRESLLVDKQMLYMDEQKADQSDEITSQRDITVNRTGEKYVGDQELIRVGFRKRKMHQMQQVRNHREML